MPKPFPPDYFVRVKDAETGAEYTQPRSIPLEGSISVIDKRAVDDSGDPLPAKTNPLPAHSSAERGSTATPGHKADSGNTEGKSV